MTFPPPFDVDALIAPLSADRPAGAPLATEAWALEQRAAPRASIVEGGATARPWLEIRREAEELLRRSKHLGVAVIETVALAHTDGWPGLAFGLKAIGLLIEHFWDVLYPPLADDGDAYPRVNALANLADSDVLKALEDMPLVGSLSLRALEAAPDSSDARAAYKTTPVECREAPSKARRSLEDVLALHEKDVLTTVLDPLIKLIERAERRMNALAGVEDAGPQNTNTTDATSTTSDASATPTEATMQTIRSSADVKVAIDLLCAYYEEHEPSSPVPLLLKRARRLVGKSFLEAIQDLADRGVEQIQTIAGQETSE